MATDTVKLLQGVPLLAGVDKRALERLARVFRERTFKEGATITTEGTSGVGFFVIVDGSASVSVGGAPRRMLGPGDYFGEMALIDDGPRSASIVAATDLRCLGLTSWDFRPFVHDNGDVAWVLLQELARRLREVESTA